MQIKKLKTISKQDFIFLGAVYIVGIIHWLLFYFLVFPEDGNKAFLHMLGDPRQWFAFPMYHAHDWHKNLNDYRDPLAHRIPFYVVPYSINKENIEKHNELNRELMSEFNLNRRAEIERQMESLGIYSGIISGSFKENKIITLHQVVPDANTLLDIIRLYVEVF